ncbi:uncharacterized protein LOC126830257 [Patella vulgata]|uniref:uncharacterized protein LOC126830257 n=1 Tax=Patella vulgata TaxID=6465 RepID=UPI0021801B67|nr:uncharacterized protein LOC126830257 [Patella vulgata]XP_050416570.1 uncharacterized protein LOC126830257 [Patella vulgata]
MSAAVNVLDLNEVLRRFAWNRLYTKSNFVKKLLLEEKDYYVDVDWKGVTVDHNIQRLSLRPSNRTYDTPFGKINAGSRWISLFTCDFENQSDSKQSHNFCGKRETTTWVGVDLKTCYTIAKDVNISINLPSQFSKYRAGRDNGVSVSKVKGEVFKEIITWEVNSHVDVRPGWRAVAELLAMEESHVMDFEITTSLFVPRGKVPIWFRRRSDDRISHLVELDSEDFTTAFRNKNVGGVLEDDECRLVTILKEMVIEQTGEESNFTCLQFTTTGSSAMVAWSDQKVDIRTEPMDVIDEEMSRTV